MKLYENEPVANAIIGALRKKMTDPSRFEGHFHASDLTRCARQVILNRQHRPSPDKPSLLRMALGHALQEWLLGPEDEGVSVVLHQDDCAGEAGCKCDLTVVFSVDKMVGDDVIEMKSTRMSPARFTTESITDGKDWTERTRLYCAIHGRKRAHIVVFFIFAGELRAWTLDFTEKDLAEGLEYARERAALLTKATADKKLPSVRTRRWAWECGWCPFYEYFCKDRLVALKLPLPDRVEVPQARA